MPIPSLITGAINSAASKGLGNMGFALPSLSSNAQSSSDGILDGLTFGGSFQVGGSGSKLTSAGPENLNSASLPMPSQANLGVIGAIAATVFMLLMLRGK